ncbi:MAG: TIGR02285 family protein [Chromatiaceae bacterium]|nr:TIGR02285 family protein [Chromatiaceae bacterium]
MLFRLLILLFAANLAAAPQITWLQTDWPPHQIVSGPFKNQGTFDLLRQQVVAALPQFSHHTRLVSLARLEQLFLQQTPGVCAVGTLYSEERQQSRLYSTPMAVGPAISIGFVRQDLFEHPAVENDAVDIVQLALDNTLRGAFQPSRYYSPVVEQALQHNATNLSRHAFTSELNAAALLRNGRVDYVLEYPERMRYYNELLEKPVKLYQLVIAGTTDASVSYITCSQGGDGEQIIAAIDAALQQLWLQPEYVLAMRRWLDDAAWQKIQNDVLAIKQSYQDLQQ